MINLPSLPHALGCSFRRELQLAARNRTEILNPLIFFVAITMFVPLGISPDAKSLAPIAPGLIWIIALLSVLLSLDKLFQNDYEDGCLEQMQVSGQSMFWLCLTKMFAYWCFTGVPLTLLSPVLGLMMSLTTEAYPALMLSLFLGTGALCFIGAIGAALTVSLRRGGLLISLIIIPLYVPVLIFGSSCVRSAAIGDPYSGQLAIVATIWLVSAMLSPLAVTGALRVSLTN